MSHGSRYFKISQSFFSTGGTTCLSDYCCWTASTRAGEPEKPILCRGRGLFDKIAWNSMKSSCSNWETEKSVVLHLIHFGSTSYQVQQLKDKIAEIQALSGAFFVLKLASCFPACHSCHCGYIWLEWLECSSCGYAQSSSSDAAAEQQQQEINALKAEAAQASCDLLRLIFQNPDCMQQKRHSGESPFGMDCLRCTQG